MRRAERLFRLVREMRAKGLCRAEDLAAELDVHVRTIYRDIAHLQGSGLPIEGAAGVGYILRPGFDLPPMTFTREQLEALALGLRFVEASADEDMAAEAVEVWSKIEAVLPDGGSSGLAQVPSFAMKRERPLLKNARVLRRAIKDFRVLKISYCDEAGRATVRNIRPLSLLVFSTGWMVASWCEEREGFRSFRIDRIGNMIETGEFFEPEEGRDMKAFMADRMDSDLALRRQPTSIR